MRPTALLLILLAVAGCAREAPPQHGFAGNRILVRIHTDGAVVELTNLRVARTPAARARGLMGVSSLPPDGGMAFLFEEPGRHPFWMKNTLIPLSIAFFEEGRIIDILDMQPCRADPCPRYRARGSFVGAIEMNRGAFDRLGVEVGNAIEYGVLSE